MKLDTNVLRYLSKDDFRVLTAIEMGQKNHEIVPLALIDSISGLKHGGAFKCIKVLQKHKLVHADSTSYVGFRLTNQGYDFLAIKTLVNRGHIVGVGRQIGVGKESDIFEVCNEAGEILALKLHRLGRTSFRAIKNKRDYLSNKNAGHFSWLYLSRLSALKEFAFMKALGDHGFPVPKAIDSNRHAVLMTLVNAVPMVQVRKMTNPGQVYITCMELMSRLAAKGLVHCDFNEFNLLINADDEVTLIDFPQMVSVSHPNAIELFDRDVECVIRYFSKKIGYEPELDPNLPYVRPNFAECIKVLDDALDVATAASGFQKSHQKELEEYNQAQAEAKARGEVSDDGDDEEEEEGVKEETEEGSDRQEAAGSLPDLSSLNLNSDSNSTAEGAPAAAATTSRLSVSFVAIARDEEEEEEGGLGQEHTDAEGVSGRGASVDGVAAGENNNEGSSDGRLESCSEEEEDVASVADTATESQRGERRKSAKARDLGEKGVQLKMTNERQKAVRRDALMRASRNTSKEAHGRKTASAKGSKHGAEPSFGGW